MGLGSAFNNNVFKSMGGGGAPTGARQSDYATPETAGAFAGPWNPQTTYVHSEDQNWGNLLEAQLGLGNAQYNSDIAYMQNQGALKAMQYQAEMDSLRKAKGNAGAQAGVARAQNDIALKALDRQGPLLDALLGLDKNEINRGRERNHMDMVWGNQSLDQQLAQLLYGRDRGTADANMKADNDIWGLRSDAVARGAITAAGTRRGYGNIQTVLQNSLSDLNKNYDWGVADVGRQREQLDMSTRHKGAQLYDDEQRLDLNHTENKAKIEDERARLNLAAKSIGLSAADTANRINAQIQKLGLQSQLDHNDLLKGLEDRRNGRATEMANVVSMMEQASGIDFNQLAGSQ